MLKTDFDVCRSQLEELLEYARIADAVYEDSQQVFAELTILEEVSSY